MSHNYEHLRNHYDITNTALERTRELYNQGMPISDLLKKIDEERFFTPNRKGPYRLVKDFYDLSDWDKDHKWRILCFANFFMECFHVGLVIQEITGLREYMKKNDTARIDYYNNEISSLIEEKRLDWEKGWYKKRIFRI